MSEDRRSPTDEAPREGELPRSPGDNFRIALPNFEGPLDLLLHLIKEHRVDIFDIPLALITEKYLEHLERMREINLDIAGEFLVMASTLAHLKSRMLLPRQDVASAQEGAEVLAVAEETEDPRAELVRRLLEYQKYKDAAEQLATQDLLGRDVFARNVPVEAVPIPEEEVGLQEFSVLKLVEALDRVLERLQPKLQHEVVRERVTLSEAILRVVERLRPHGQVLFESLFTEEETPSRQEVVITFLAILEMVKRRLIRVVQDEPLGPILLLPNGDALEKLAPTEVDDSDYR
ncbi:segregation and condensation protein A [Myxococcus xanthus DK 1622]|uniref:Segregation and condensation protein A n=2 Tax=Myxococcus xanthus TaxID=34 RepID=SCPA_MYXXD|nr:MULTISPECIES: segregation/condensation protein A [Myxococcus]ABF92600.1 segregation and condensation protein A [Myxococcus xanthus DK 1622]NOJ55988.1 segregation/condensation protein A [Myxococcus xanthus]QPM76468.1 segregation/condensation protein A [Myxococcus xanthus]QVW65531.1 segregation/condensation protein A [Myxococcus xanthus DZ2]QZZ51530.1 Segregation and condensation protein A [Myxococcus xanthus]